MNASYENRRRHRIQMLSDICDGCGACVAACPTDTLAMDGDPVRAKVQSGFMCIGCYACVQACTKGAITIEDPRTVRIKQ